ncbi:MAG TPA: succinate dehydrogenase/fumarate reductase flavoprotein subunit, partial [Burkholderiales bacterium]|nr:succinate dehydrogenase/fumarate reductase flavoprotein subunit [Burkholderiales bacterium]
RGAASLEPIREKLYDIMWEKVGIIRDATGLLEAQADLNALERALDGHSLPGGERAFNLAWHDWLNLKSLVAVSRAIAAAAIARRDSRGAHFRSDFPESGPLEQSAFTSIRNGIVSMKPVAFTRVAPGETLLRHVA